MLILLDDSDRCVTARDATVFERLVSHVRAAKLDRELAGGARADGSAVRALRAQALVRPSMRRALARSVEELVEEAAIGGHPLRTEARVPIRRETVMEAADELQVLVGRLLAPGPVRARGVAEVKLLLTDGAGPIYYPGDTGDLRASVLNAAEDLQPLNDSWIDE